MNTANFYVDLHCHPALKPYGKSFNSKTAGKNATRRSSKNSIWHYDPPSVFDKVLNYLTGLTKFSQSNFTALAYGGVGVVCVSLYPMEKWFVRNKMNNEFLLDLAANFATGLGKKRIDHIQGFTDYFKDLQAEYAFYKQLDGKVVTLKEGKFRYRLVNSYTEIDIIKAQEEEQGIYTVCVILSIEGLHVLNTGFKEDPDEQEVLRNLEQLKNWEHPPLFVTMAHHFWNHICGHEESFSGLIKKQADQRFGMGLGFTALGKKVLDLLLDTSKGSQILIDVKHMSVKARYEYYLELKTHAAYTGLPILISHGAVNGLKSPEEPVMVYPETAQKLHSKSINFYDEELIILAKSGGIIGLQLDERRVASEQTLKTTRHATRRHKIMHYRSELLWNQIQHILEVLDAEGLFAWDCMAIGSDFDGIIDPLNAFWTAEELPYLSDFLERHAYNYLQQDRIHKEFNKIPAGEMIDRIMSLNAMAFLQKHF
ncbi:microsomal dipeptidase-like Zn-dependent dipeptidase [Leeuwenhoekiella aestuarii]|uniref:membrane dipeptidase n=1 Tax=Leeuwenhoekiella aestuarii TaxID=2249426 RepID=UPI000FFEE707|nr:membrane dipeptidase [Leeuwenhoekiella aestuarii]RXG12937.1 microsomal dipeptidase-like Zn-dependent dipeptidase [Leeuwenhoekiella aestuarii]